MAQSMSSVYSVLFTYALVPVTMLLVNSVFHTARDRQRRERERKRSELSEIIKINSTSEWSGTRRWQLESPSVLVEVSELGVRAELCQAG